MFAVLSLQIQKTVIRKAGNEEEGQFCQQDFLRITTVPWVLLGASEYASFCISSVYFITFS